MKFVDEAMITVQAGNGGHGCLSFRREKFVPRGGGRRSGDGVGGGARWSRSEGWVPVHLGGSYVVGGAQA